MEFTLGELKRQVDDAVNAFGEDMPVKIVVEVDELDGHATSTYEFQWHTIGWRSVEDSIVIEISFDTMITSE